MTKTHFENDEAMAYIYPMSLLASAAIVIAWVLLVQATGSIGLSFDMFVDDGTMSVQTATVAANTLALFGMYPVALIFGWFGFVMVASNNLRNAGWAGSMTPFINGAIFMLVAFVIAYLFALSSGVIVDSIEQEVLDPAAPIADIPASWQDAQGEVSWFINLLMLMPYVIEGVGVFVFLQSILATTSGGAYYPAQRYGR